MVYLTDETSSAYRMVDRAYWRPRQAGDFRSEEVSKCRINDCQHNHLTLPVTILRRCGCSRCRSHRRPCPGAPQSSPAPAAGPPQSPLPCTAPVNCKRKFSATGWSSHRSQQNVPAPAHHETPLQNAAGGVFPAKNIIASPHHCTDSPQIIAGNIAPRRVHTALDKATSPRCGR